MVTTSEHGLYRQGFLWPTAVSDAQSAVQTCEGCQFFARQPHVLATELQTIMITWPFATWNLDMVGPFRIAPEGFTHLFVAIDKFTKWIEAKPMASRKEEKIMDFITEIMHRYRGPQ